MAAPEELVLVGRVVRPWGAAGQVVVEPATDNRHRFAPGSVLLVAGRRLTVERSFPRRGRWVVRFAEIHDPAAAESLRGEELCVEATALPPLEAGHYYDHQLLGCTVQRPDGRVLGTVTGVVRGARGAAAWLEVERAGTRALLPMVGEWLREVDVAARRIVLEAPPGIVEATAIPPPKGKAAGAG